MVGDCVPTHSINGRCWYWNGFSMDMAIYKEVKMNFTDTPEKHYATVAIRSLYTQKPDRGCADITAGVTRSYLQGIRKSGLLPQKIFSVI